MKATSQARVPEASMLNPLLDWLHAKRWIREDTLVIPEFPWNGRRIDLVTLTRTGVLSAYELKINHTSKVLFQGSLNAVCFDRSFIVSGSKPSPENLTQAKQLGLGVLLMDLKRDQITSLLSPRIQGIGESARARLHKTLRRSGDESHVQ